MHVILQIRVARPHRNFGRVSARLTDWVGPAAQGYVTVSAGGATIIASLAFEDPATIIRTRGMVSIIPQSHNADLNIVGAFGIGVVSAEAAAAGVASVPEPFSDADWGGWFVWRSFAYTLEALAGAEQFSVILYDWNFEIDSKAMRKVTSNEVMVVVVESQAGALLAFDGTRHLIKLP